MKKRGFTVAELLIIIAIIALIIGIGTPIVIGMLENSNKSADEAQADLVTEVLENWVEDYEQYKLKVDDKIGIEDVKGEMIEKIVRQGYPSYFKDIEDITLWDLSEFESNCLTEMGYPKDAEMLRIVLRYYIDDNALKTKATGSAFYYIPNKGTIMVNKVEARAADIKKQTLDYEITEKDEIYRLTVSGDTMIKLGE